ncbi:hypothetical protein [Mesorhizobium retamae]|uniref:Uncharacterized protein n=1 Tax=Mesorhizobium retamae TaxID=2912854 RepID=A0ABS9QD83_9HYPH|nr:hypothetical protein [Mesorhizobium sp. IRAMC:0171]MCG7505372.1 hypothetical protein [Mesorhizobium sp. IRAMC:0171]
MNVWPKTVSDCRIFVCDTITIISEAHAGSVVVSGSHGGLSSAKFVLGKRLLGVIFNDAGGGKDGAGIAGLDVLERAGLPAAAVGCTSARIGNGEHMWVHGRISHANPAATALGVRSDQKLLEAAEILYGDAPVEREIEDRDVSTLLRCSATCGDNDIVVLDSVSMLTPGDADKIVVTGSHGGIPAGDYAIRFRPGLTVFNDAGVGCDHAGIAALTRMDVEGLAAVAINCMTGRIGDPRDMLQHGVISFVNKAARARGAKPGSPLSEMLAKYPPTMTAADRIS